MCYNGYYSNGTLLLVMVEGEAEGIDEATFCEAVLMGLESVSVVRCW